MTTLKDYIKDMIIEALEEDRNAQKDGQVLAEEGIEQIIESNLPEIIARLIGYEI